MKFSWKKHRLQFIRPGGTSRGVLHYKDSWFIIAEDDQFKYPALGECSIIEGLSPDPPDQFEAKLDEVCSALQSDSDIDLKAFPAIKFGLEMLRKDIESRGSKVLYPSHFTEGEQEIRINGLIWMGDPEFMNEQLLKKVDEGSSCIKIKIGALDLQTELEFLRSLRSRFGTDIELRVDANGAFSPEKAMNILEQLNQFKIHSIEQPIKSGQWEAMAKLCEETPIPIALDEELIGIKSKNEKEELLEAIKPQYIILKPSLVGGLRESHEWIKLAESVGIGWWMTSALESNVGLNVIAQFAYSIGVSMPQGLGTGSLFANNFESPLSIRGEMLRFNPDFDWNLEGLKQDG